MSDGSVSRWLIQLQAGDPAAAQPLWECYFQRLVGLARTVLRGARRGAGDEEDAALSAFDSFCRGAADGRFPQLHDRDNLWRLLVVITARKAYPLIRTEARHRPAGDADLEWVIGREPSPAFAAQVSEACRHLLDVLPDDRARAVAVGKMEGFTNAELAVRIGCAPRTIERKLQLIR